MAKINISEYPRPGVYTNEVNDSVRQVAAANSTKNFLVPGFSRRGPVNRPILISSPQELLAVFGDVDRHLEKKGCFFHRTILNLLSTAPVWAINLLSTNDELDKLEWAAISTSSNGSNSVVKQSPVSRFYDQSDFWYLDTDSFVDLARENETGQVLHIANLSDKKASVFFYKSSNPAFNVTLENWYSGKSNVPLYLHPTDLASDYLVNMVVVAGDWSNYANLAVDSRWSKYFNKSGLKKDAVQAFISDAAVTLLRNYADLSLIPYFKDNRGKDMFIESVVNANTATTGIFVGFDIDALESATASTGLLDLIGNNLVSDNRESINYLSYKENISEVVTFPATALDRAGNAFGAASLNLETKVTKGSLANLVVEKTVGAGATQLKVVNGSIANVIIGGVKVTPNTTNNVVLSEDASQGYIRKDTLYIDAQGSLGLVKGVEVRNNVSSWEVVPLKPVPANTVAIGYVTVGTHGTLSTPVSTATLNTVGTPAANPAGVQSLLEIVNLTSGTTPASDITITYAGSNEMTITLNNTRATDSDVLYKKSRLLTLFNQVSSKFKSGSSIVRDADGNKAVVTDFTLVTDGDENKSLTVRVSPNVNLNRGGNAEVYFLDDELVFTPATGNSSAGVKSSTTAGYGTVAESSSLYQAYVKGNINSGDYFFPSLYSHKITKAEFSRPNGVDTISLYYNGTEIDPSKLSNRSIKISGSSLNEAVFTINSQSVSTITGDYTKRVDLIVNETVKPENAVNRTISVLDASNAKYLKMYFMNKNLTVEFTDSSDLIGSTTINFATQYSLDEIQVLSKRNNFKQSLEIERIVETNKILVTADMYSNIKVGDYLQAYVDETELEKGEVAKRLTRIVSKKLYNADPSLVEIVTDSQIDVTYYGADGAEAQTFRFSTMENYVSTYVAVVLNGFKVREESMPNGTDVRQEEILGMIEKGSPLFKGLANRNKISWRYLVDAWGNGLVSNSKHHLVTLCGSRLTAFGLINMPSARDFKNCSATSFVDNKTKALRTDFITQGGDPESNPSFLYSFASGNGQSNVAYAFPFVTVVEDGRSVSVPPASFIGNLFMNKHTSRLASVKPWSVAAGLANGQVTGFSNVEFDLADEDITNLHQMGANPIVYKMNRGFCLDTNNTAQQSPKSALSSIHVREGLIELEEELYQMLLGFQSLFNTQGIRETIKREADAICQRYVAQDALYSFSNFVDDDAENIDLGVGILNTYVEPVRELSVLVNNITILKTGEIKSGGFANN